MNNSIKEEAIKEEAAPAEKKERTSRGFFSLLFTGEFLSKDAAVALMPFFFFMFLLSLLYISNRHFAEKNVRQIDRINKELKELKWEYVTAKAELMYESKQTEVAKRVAPLGLKESTVPPKKIIVD